MKRIIKDFALSFALLFAVAMAAGMTMMALAFFESRDSIATPEVVGLDLLGAIEALNEVGLSVRIARRVSSDEFAPNAVISQEPRAGEPTLEGRFVEVIVSSGSRAELVEDFVGRRLDRADALGGGRYRISTIEIDSTEFARSIIIAQNPPAGSPIERTPVELEALVSSGPPVGAIAVPDLIGLSMEEAASTMADSGVRLERIKWKSAAGVPRGVAIAQAPPPASRIEVGGYVELTLSSAEAVGEVGPSDSYRFLRYAVPGRSGPERLVKLIERNENGERVLYSGRARPGESISTIVTVKGVTTVEIYLDETLIDARRYE